MDTQASAVYTCLHYPHRCVAQKVPRKAVAYGALYGFVRETVYDARDIMEDNQQGVTTLPTTIGMRRTKLLLGLTTAVGELLIAQRKWMTLNMAIRTGITMGLILFVLKHPRIDSLAWGAFCALSLIPAFCAQIEIEDII